MLNYKYFQFKTHQSFYLHLEIYHSYQSLYLLSYYFSLLLGLSSSDEDSCLLYAFLLLCRSLELEEESEYFLLCLFLLCLQADFYESELGVRSLLLFFYLLCFLSLFYLLLSRLLDGLYFLGLYFRSFLQESSPIQSIPYNLFVFDVFALGLALISTLDLSKPNPAAPEGAQTSLFLIFFNSSLIYYQFNFQSSYQASPKPRAEFILSISFLIASSCSDFRFGSLYFFYVFKYQSLFLHFPPRSKTPITAEFPRYISRSLYGFYLTDCHSKRLQPPLLPGRIGTQNFLFYFSYKLVMTIQLNIIQSLNKLRQIISSIKIQLGLVRLTKFIYTKIQMQLYLEKQKIGTKPRQQRAI